MRILTYTGALRFYTRALYDQLDDDDADPEALLTQAHDAYKQRLSEIAGTLGDLISISHPFHVDNALIARLRHDREAGVLHLTLRCGNLIEGYRDLILAYHDVELDHADENILNDIAATTVGGQIFDHDVYCHELDVAEDARIEHRILFNCGPEEVAIRCRRLVHTKQDQPDRTLPALAERTGG
ncbi:MAG: hypothetical protein ACR2HJ_08735 [Fimbriimonadales bacterium]